MQTFLRNQIKAHQAMISELETQLKKLDGEIVEEPVGPSRNEKVLRIAALELGTKEVSGSGNNAKVVEYHRYASKSNNVDQPDSVPWCSSFVCYLVEKSGMGSTNSMMARS